MRRRSRRRRRLPGLNLRMVSCYALHIICPRHLQIMDTDKVDMNEEGERYE